jgi:DNA adenine methylase
VIANMPQHRVYVEPFGGGGSVLLRKERAYAEIYNDLDGVVVNVFRVLRDPVAALELKQALALTPFARAELEAAFEPTGSPVERARLTLALSFMGFGSDSVTSDTKTGFRSLAHGNGAYPSMEWMRMPAQVTHWCERLRGVTVECKPAVLVIPQHDDERTLYYVDPPYTFDSRARAGKGVTGGYRHEMDDADHRELAGVLRGLKGMVMLSGYPSALYDELYGDWNRLERAALADGAKKRTEVLWFNPAAWNARPQMELMEREVCS